MTSDRLGNCRCSVGPLPHQPHQPQDWQHVHHLRGEGLTTRALHQYPYVLTGGPSRSNEQAKVHEGWNSCTGSIPNESNSLIQVGVFGASCLPSNDDEYWCTVNCEGAADWRGPACMTSGLDRSSFVRSLETPRVTSALGAQYGRSLKESGASDAGVKESGVLDGSYEAIWHASLDFPSRDPAHAVVSVTVHRTTGSLGTWRYDVSDVLQSKGLRKNFESSVTSLESVAWPASAPRLRTTFRLCFLGDCEQCNPQAHDLEEIDGCGAQSNPQQHDAATRVAL